MNGSFLTNTLHTKYWFPALEGSMMSRRGVSEGAGSAQDQVSWPYYNFTKPASQPAVRVTSRWSMRVTLEVYPNLTLTKRFMKERALSCHLVNCSA